MNLQALTSTAAKGGLRIGRRVIREVSDPIHPNREYPFKTDRAPFLEYIAAAKRSIQLVEDPESLKKDSLDALIKAAERGVSVKIVFEHHPSYTEEVLRKLNQLASHQGIDLYQYRLKPDRHFIIIDGVNVGSEEKHRPGQLTRFAFMERNSPTAGLYSGEDIRYMMRQSLPYRPK